MILLRKYYIEMLLVGGGLGPCWHKEEDFGFCVQSREKS